MKDVVRALPKGQKPEDLYHALEETYQLIQKAHSEYQQAVHLAAGTEISADRAIAIQQQGREYAEAVMRYSEAVMAWLGQVNSNRDKVLKLIQKATTAE